MILCEHSIKVFFKPFTLLSFLGIGGMFYINSNGDRDADFALTDLDPLTGDWKVSDSIEKTKIT